MTDKSRQNHALLKELIPHGNMMFPLTVHEMDTDCRFDERIGCHWHDEFEILAVTSGTAQIHIDDECFNIKKGDAAVIPAGRLHMAIGKADIPFSFLAVVFHPSFLSSYSNDNIQQQYLDAVSDGQTTLPDLISGDTEWGQKTFQSLMEIGRIFSRRETGFELLIKARLFEIWYLLFIHAQKRKDRTVNNNDYRTILTKSIIEYIQTHYETGISLPELSKRFHISEGHLCRFFKSVTRMSVLEYTNAYRISVSANLLRETDLDISAVAGMTGFNNISYFNKIFRRFMYMTPTEYRKSENQTALFFQLPRL